MEAVQSSIGWSQMWWFPPERAALWKAEAGGYKVQTQRGQFSPFARPCLKIKIKGLGMQLSMKAVGSVPITEGKGVSGEELRGALCLQKTG